MIDAVILSEGRLDFLPREAVLPDAPGPWRERWSAQVSVTPGLSRVLEVNGTPVLINAPGGITGLDTSPPSADREFADRLIRARAGVDGRAVLFDEAGHIYRWTLGSPAEHVWDVDVPWNELEAIGLAGGRLLIRRSRGGSMLGPALRKLGAGWVTELVEQDSAVRWRHNGDLHDVFPWRDALFAFAEDPRKVLRLDADRGKQSWEHALNARISSLIGVVNETLWLTSSEGEIVGLQIEAGTVAARLQPDGIAFPDGVVDSKGRLHLCTGSNYTILDLTAHGATETAGPLSRGEVVPSLIFGRAAIPTADGRLIIRDRNGSLFSVRPGAAPDLLWRSPVPLLDCRAAQGMLYLLDRQGKLSLIAP